MSDLDAAQILTLRRLWIRDEWQDFPVALGISDYNTARRRAFFSDDDIKALDDRIQTYYRDELAALRTADYEHWIDLDHSEADANTYADASKLDARYGLITAEARIRMLEDPDFVYSLGERYEGTVELWKNANDAIYARFRSRAGGLMTIEAVRE